MSYIAAEDVAKAKEMDLLTYLRNYEPQELVRVSGNFYLWDACKGLGRQSAKGRNCYGELYSS